MNKFLLVFYLTGTGIALTAGNNQKVARSISITGRIEAEKKFEISDLRKFKIHTIGDMIIVNHKGEPKGTAKSLKGVLLRDVLETLALDTDNPKLFSEYYFTCRASDGYTIVYSWNELFNTATGNTAYIILEKEGKPIDHHQDGILIISAADVHTGRRYLKNLETITAGRVD